MPAFDGKRYDVNLTFTVLGVTVRVKGTVEALDVRRELKQRAKAIGPQRRQH